MLSIITIILSRPPYYLLLLRLWDLLFSVTITLFRVMGAKVPSGGTDPNRSLFHTKIDSFVIGLPSDPTRPDPNQIID